MQNYVDDNLSRVSDTDVFLLKYHKQWLVERYISLWALPLSYFKCHFWPINTIEVAVLWLLTCFLGGGHWEASWKILWLRFVCIWVMKRAVAKTGIVVLINAWADQCIRIKNFPFETFLSPFLIDLSSPFFHLEIDVYFPLCLTCTIWLTK